MLPCSPDWLTQLLLPSAYPHPVKRVELVETHISWLLLTGEFVYKIKKPVDLGFLNFSTLGQRKHYCEEEYRLNHRLTPELYLGVVGIGYRLNTLCMECDQDIIDYAVKLRQFDPTALADNLLARDALTPALIADLASEIARVHQTIPSAAQNSHYGITGAVGQPMEDNFNHIAALPESRDHTDMLSHLHERSRREFYRHTRLFEQRHAQGHIRECHGDMHLGNMVLLDGRLRLFDCIEFNPELYWIDTLSDIAFTVMDLEHRGYQALANQLLNHYLELTGDYEGVPLLPHYLAYRAMVRAKVACIRAHQQATDTTPTNALAEYHDYLAQADRYLAPAPTPRLIITHGLSGSGKSTVTHELMQRLGVIRLRSDIERKRLHGLPACTQSQSGLESGLYRPQATERTYARLHELTSRIVGSGQGIIVDATFLAASQRQAFQSLAAKLGANFHILQFVATPNTLRQNIRSRLQHRLDASEADLHVLEYQLEGYSELTAEERQHSIVVNMDLALPPAQQAEEIQHRLNLHTTAYRPERPGAGQMVTPR